MSDFFIHFSDTHLGYGDYDKSTDEGVNMREQDVYDAFEYVIDYILKNKPRFVLHTGDFFHRPSPPNRPLTFAIQQMSRLSKAGIDTYIIAGNHSTPKSKYTSPILKAFDSLEHIYPIYQQAYELFETDDFAIHGVPHINDPKVADEEYNKIKIKKGKKNIIMLHASIAKDYYMDEFGEQIFPPQYFELLNKIDYVALGHWHRSQPVKFLNNAWYAGSTEQIGENEAGQAKGFLKIHFDELHNPQFISIPVRKWHSLEIEDCQSKSKEEIISELEVAISEIDLKDAIISLTLVDITSVKAVELSKKILGEILNDSAHLIIKRKFVHLERKLAGTELKQVNIKSLLTEFIKDNSNKGEEQQLLISKANDYLSSVEENRHYDHS